MKKLTCIFLILTLTGCGLVVQKEARDEMIASKAKYKQCLNSHPQSAAACDGLKAAYKADMEALKQVSPDFSTVYDVNIDHNKD